MAEAKAEKLVPRQQLQLAKDSSLFSQSSFHENMLKKRESNRSTVALAQEPGAKTSNKRPRQEYQNTYRLEPNRMFEASKVKKILDETLESYLKDEKYDPKSCRQLVQTLTEIIKTKVKDLNYERYKIVCMVTIGQSREQGVRMGSRCAWDAKRDTFAASSFKNKSLFAVATVWGVYYE